MQQLLSSGIIWILATISISRFLRVYKFANSLISWKLYLKTSNGRLRYIFKYYLHLPSLVYLKNMYVVAIY